MGSVPVKVWEQLRRKGVSHWVVVATLTIAGVLVGHHLSESDVWIDVRYAIYQKAMDAALVHDRLYPKRTVLVLVGDDTYWSGELAGRAPIKRDFLARLVEKIAEVRPAAIAIDFDLRSPAPDGSIIEHPDYERETAALRSAIARVAQTTPVIVPASVGLNSNGEYFRVSGILDGGMALNAGVHEGYLQLPYDKRRVPLQLELADERTLDSFSLAICAAVDPVSYKRVISEHKDSLPFVSYMTEQDFRSTDEKSSRVLDAGELLSGNSVASSLAHSIVIVSGSWSTLGKSLGPRIDMHPTPAGRQPGSLVHANFVEAILAERTFDRVPEWLAIALEVLIVVLIAVVFALPLRGGTKVFVALAGSGSLALLCLIGLQNLGLFFDFFVPVVILAAHLAIEKVLEWRKVAKRAKQAERQAVERLRVSV